ncbi:MAG: ABC transporter substrate-binding protein [Candidatus Methylomirabilota bacterium]|nr:MAG: ABC transporter substrate-binding protein [candidate division NC10 bacterium]
MRRAILLIGIALWLLCGVADAAPLTVIDDAGRSVTLSGSPKRIMTLTPGHTEILFALGAGDRIVAVDQWSDFPSAAKGKPQIVPFNPNLEQVVRLNPDLILSTYGGAEPLLPLQRYGISVMIFAPRTLEHLYRNILLIGRIVDAEARAEGLVRVMRQRVAAVTAKVRDAPRPQIFIEVDGADPDRPFTAGPGSFVDALVQLAGGVNVAAHSRTAWPEFSLEELVKADPDLIVLADPLAPSNPDALEQVARRPGWGRVRAVRLGRIATIDANLISRPGPRIVDGLERLARLLHPDRVQ